MSPLTVRASTSLNGTLCTKSHKWFPSTTTEYFSWSTFISIPYDLFSLNDRIFDLSSSPHPPFKNEFLTVLLLKNLGLK